MNPRSVRTAAIATAALAVFYAGVVWAASGSFDHLVEQARLDWYYLALIMGGFAVQVALVSELRRRHRLQHSAAARHSRVSPPCAAPCPRRRR